MNIGVCESSSVCDPGWVSQWVYVLHLDIYVSKCDNIGPPCGELCLLWIVACLPHRVGATCLSPNCGMQPNHLETLTLPETAGFTRAWHAGWWDCKILKWHMQMFGNSRGAVRKNQKSCCGNAEQDWSVERTGADFLTELQTQKLYVKKKVWNSGKWGADGNVKAVFAVLCVAMPSSDCIVIGAGWFQGS